MPKMLNKTRNLNTCTICCEKPLFFDTHSLQEHYERFHLRTSPNRPNLMWRLTKLENERVKLIGTHRDIKEELGRLQQCNLTRKRTKDIVKHEISNLQQQINEKDLKINTIESLFHKSEVSSSERFENAFSSNTLLKASCLFTKHSSVLPLEGSRTRNNENNAVTNDVSDTTDTGLAKLEEFLLSNFRTCSNDLNSQCCGKITAEDGRSLCEDGEKATNKRLNEDKFAEICQNKLKQQDIEEAIFDQIGDAEKTDNFRIPCIKLEKELRDARCSLEIAEKVVATLTKENQILNENAERKAREDNDVSQVKCRRIQELATDVANLKQEKTEHGICFDSEFKRWRKEKLELETSIQSSVDQNKELSKRIERYEVERQANFKQAEEQEGEYIELQARYDSLFRRHEHMKIQITETKAFAVEKANAVSQLEREITGSKKEKISLEFDLKMRTMELECVQNELVNVKSHNKDRVKAKTMEHDRCLKTFTEELEQSSNKEKKLRIELEEMEASFKIVLNEKDKEIADHEINLKEANEKIEEFRKQATAANKEFYCQKMSNLLSNLHLAIDNLRMELLQERWDQFNNFQKRENACNHSIRRSNKHEVETNVSCLHDFAHKKQYNVPIEITLTEMKINRQYELWNAEKEVLALELFLKTEQIQRRDKEIEHLMETLKDKEIQLQAFKQLKAISKEELENDLKASDSKVLSLSNKLKLAEMKFSKLENEHRSGRQKHERCFNDLEKARSEADMYRGKILDYVHNSGFPGCVENKQNDTIEENFRSNETCSWEALSGIICTGSARTGRGDESPVVSRVQEVKKDHSEIEKGSECPEVTGIDKEQALMNSGSAKILQDELPDITIDADRIEDPNELGVLSTAPPHHKEIKSKHGSGDVEEDVKEDERHNSKKLGSFDRFEEADLKLKVEKLSDPHDETSNSMSLKDSSCSISKSTSKYGPLESENKPNDNSICLDWFDTGDDQNSTRSFQSASSQSSKTSPAKDYLSVNEEISKESDKKENSVGTKIAKARWNLSCTSYSDNIHNGEPSSKLIPHSKDLSKKSMSKHSDEASSKSISHSKDLSTRNDELSSKLISHSKNLSTRNDELSSKLVSHHSKGLSTRNGKPSSKSVWHPKKLSTRHDESSSKSISRLKDFSTRSDEPSTKSISYSEDSSTRNDELSSKSIPHSKSLSNKSVSKLVDGLSSRSMSNSRDSSRKSMSKRKDGPSLKSVSHSKHSSIRSNETFSHSKNLDRSLSGRESGKNESIPQENSVSTIPHKKEETVSRNNSSKSIEVKSKSSVLLDWFDTADKSQTSNRSINLTNSTSKEKSCSRRQSSVESISDRSRSRTNSTSSDQSFSKEKCHSRENSSKESKSEVGNKLNESFSLNRIEKDKNTHYSNRFISDGSISEDLSRKSHSCKISSKDVSTTSLHLLSGNGSNNPYEYSSDQNLNKTMVLEDKNLLCNPKELSESSFLDWFEEAAKSPDPVESMGKEVSPTPKDWSTNSDPSPRRELEDAKQKTSSKDNSTKSNPSSRNLSDNSMHKTPKDISSMSNTVSGNVSNNVKQNVSDNSKQKTSSKGRSSKSNPSSRNLSDNSTHKTPKDISSMSNTVSGHMSNNVKQNISGNSKQNVSDNSKHKTSSNGRSSKSDRFEIHHDSHDLNGSISKDTSIRPKRSISLNDSRHSKLSIPKKVHRSMSKNLDGSNQSKLPNSSENREKIFTEHTSDTNASKIYDERGSRIVQQELETPALNGTPILKEGSEAKIKGKTGLKADFQNAILAIYSELKVYESGNQKESKMDAILDDSVKKKNKTCFHNLASKSIKAEDNLEEEASYRSCSSDDDRIRTSDQSFGSDSMFPLDDPLQYDNEDDFHRKNNKKKSKVFKKTKTKEKKQAANQASNDTKKKGKKKNKKKMKQAVVEKTLPPLKLPAFRTRPAAVMLDAGLFGKPDSSLPGGTDTNRDSQELIPKNTNKIGHEQLQCSTPHLKQSLDNANRNLGTIQNLTDAALQQPSASHPSMLNTPNSELKLAPVKSQKSKQFVAISTLNHPQGNFENKDSKELPEGTSSGNSKKQLTDDKILHGFDDVNVFLEDFDEFDAHAT